MFITNALLICIIAILGGVLQAATVLLILKWLGIVTIILWVLAAIASVVQTGKFKLKFRL